MKYRIKKEITTTSTKYYPQYRSFGFWCNFYGLNGCVIFSFHIEDAQSVIDRDRSVSVIYIDA